VRKIDGDVMQGRIKKKAVAGVFVALILWAAAGHSQSASLEYQVKASYLYNFMRFIAWPNDVFGGDGKFQLCVMGADRFGSALKALAGERVDGREIVVREVDQSTPARAARCHLLFVAAGTGAEDLAAERGLLTIGETPGFLARGGIINLVEVQGKIRFEINHTAAQRAGLVVSSRLLDLSKR